MKSALLVATLTAVAGASVVGMIWLELFIGSRTVDRQVCGSPARR